jgi:iron complex transport system substrate-binding protein
LRALPLPRLVAAVLLGALALTACGDGDDPSPKANDGAPATSPVGFPVRVESAGEQVTIPARPVRIVSLTPTATEMLYAMGAGGQVTAVDDQSDFPAEAPRTDLSGFTPNAEAIIARTPDLVVVSDDTNGVVKALEAVRIPVVRIPAAATFEDAYAQITTLGLATGHPAEATTLVERMRGEIQQAVAAARKPARPLTYFHELGSELYTATSKTFIGQVYSLFGLVNIADAADTTGSGYPRMSAEAIVTASPDLVFLADSKCCGQNPRTVAARPGWDRIAAVRNNGVVPMDDDIASRWGPRIVDYVKAVAAAVDRAATAPASAG